jgi:hypothetical protein
MKAKLEETFIQTIRSAAQKLTGADRRAFQAEVTRDYCKGSPRIAERTFGWSRQAVQKGLTEQETGNIIADKERSGRPSYSHRLSNLQDDIRSLVDPNTCTHPTFANTFRYTRITAKAVIEALVKEKGYKEEILPAECTMRALLNKMNYRLRRVQKTLCCFVMAQKKDSRDRFDLRQREICSCKKRSRATNPSYINGYENKSQTRRVFSWR